jgi:1,4-alpha-glucan branching enzyme
MNRMLLMGIGILLSMASRAQLLTWTPDFPVENNSSQSLVITVDATKGNKGLFNYTPTGDVYVHVGVITNLSSSPTDWRHVIFAWGTTNAAANATYLGNNKWQFTINGSLRTFFGITDASETIQKIAIIFRNGAGTLKQVNTDNSDMYIPVYTSNLAVRINTPPFQPKYTPVPEPQSWSIGTNFSVQASANRPSTLKLYYNGTVIATATGAQTISANATVTAAGTQQLIAEANDGTTTKYDTMNLFVAPPTQIAALPAGVRDGVNYDAGNTSVTLVLRAPGKGYVTVIGDFNNWTPGTNYIMNKTPDGKFFWLQVTGLTPGTEYAFQYNVDDTLKIADPYSEKILDPNNDQYISAATYPNLKAYPAGKTTGIVGVLQTGAPAYSWKVNSFARPDQKSLVIYELLVRDYVAAHDWKTLRDTLNYIKTLGFNAIEVMPFNEFEGNVSWGYNPDFYFTPDKYYGPANTLKEFIDSCHSKGISVVMDIALNHQFGSSPMVQLYWDPANSRPAPNNPWFNPVPKHAFNVGYDMNHESADTKYFFGRVAEYWLQQFKIDGFRFDLSKGFTQTQTCDASGNNCDVNAWGNYDQSRINIWEGYYDTIQNKSPNAYVILEHFAADNEEVVLSNYGANGMLLWNNMAYAYEQAGQGYVSNSSLERAIPSTHGFSRPNLVTYAESHDEERIVYLNENYGRSFSTYNIKDTATALKRMELDAAFLLTIPGPKMVWQFGELGYDYPINYCQNGTINNNCRLDPKPIRWDYLNDPRRKSVHDVYAKLINLRFHPWYKDAFANNTVSDRSLTGAFKYLVLKTDTSNLVAIGNFDVSTNSGTVTFPSSGTWYDLLANTTFTATGTPQSFTLQPGEYHVYANRNVNSLTATAINPVSISNNSLDADVYPNPAGGQFTVEVNVPQAGNVTLDLLDALGQRVQTLHSGVLPKGVQQLTFNRKVIPGANGVYFLQVSTKSALKTIQISLQ